MGTSVSPCLVGKAAALQIARGGSCELGDGAHHAAHLALRRGPALPLVPGL